MAALPAVPGYVESS